MQSETTRSQGGWLLLVLALPLCVVVLERVVLPLFVRWVCRGRATVRSASLVRGAVSYTHLTLPTNREV